MKKYFILSFLVLSIASRQANAQSPFNTMDSVDINNITALTLVHGDMWWNPQLQVAACQFPAHSGKSVNFAGALWMSGYDGAGQLHVAAQTYRQEGNDYWPGPLDSGDTLTYATSSAWAKIWKVNRTDIQYFQSLTTHTTTNTPEAILTWPAKGNTYAQGNGGTPLTITTDMAPFVDLNADGIYEPLLGEYPDVPGDQALWWVFSDNGPTHNQSKGRPIDVEVHAMAYAYNRGTLIDNVIYYEYNLINRGPNNYNNFRIAEFDDIDLGWYDDDYIGFDSTWRMGIDYNGTNCDGCYAGSPVNSYGVDPPQSAVTMIVLPGDAGSSYVPAGSFIYFNNDMSVIGNPTIDSQFNNYMRAKIRTGVHYSNDFAGAGVPSVAYGTGSSCNYVYPGDPSDSAQWSECTCGDNPGDRRFVISSNDFTLNSGASQKIVFAFIATDSAGGCPVASFTNIKIVADTAWGDYYNPPPPLPTTGVTNMSSPGAVNIYPNPAHDKLFLENTNNITGNESITIYNTLGQVMNVPISQSGQKSEMDISELPSGVYYILYRYNDAQTSAKFVKE